MVWFVRNHLTSYYIIYNNNSHTIWQPFNFKKGQNLITMRFLIEYKSIINKPCRGPLHHLSQHSIAINNSLLHSSQRILFHNLQLSISSKSFNRGQNTNLINKFGDITADSKLILLGSLHTSKFVYIPVIVLNSIN